MAGFADVPQTCIQVYYPKDGVSPVQERQMVTQEGENVGRLRGASATLMTPKPALSASSPMRLSGRSWTSGVISCPLPTPSTGAVSCRRWSITSPPTAIWCGTALSPMGDKVNFCVPTGNFGDILAAYYAKRMGLPVGRLICASNSNNVLTDFLRTGIYDRNRPVPYHHQSPSMDILISSNLERLLF